MDKGIDAAAAVEAVFLDYNRNSDAAEPRAAFSLVTEWESRPSIGGYAPPRQRHLSQGGRTTSSPVCVLARTTAAGVMVAARRPAAIRRRARPARPSAA